MEKTVVEICATVVTAQVQCRQMTSEEISESIRLLYGTLEALNRADCQPHESTVQATEAPDSLAALRLQPKQTFQKDGVVCLECGRMFRLLGNRHLALHGLTPREYKRKWGISLTTALSARTLTTQRSKIAKKTGIGQALADWRAARNQLTG